MKICQRTFVPCLVLLALAGAIVVGAVTPVASAKKASSCGCGHDGESVPHEQTADERPTKTYLWNSHPTVFLTIALDSIGIDPERAAYIANGTMAQTRREAIDDPKRFLVYTLMGAGFEEERAILSADHAIAKLTERFGKFMSLEEYQLSLNSEENAEPLPAPAVEEYYRKNPAKQLGTRARHVWTARLHGSLFKAFLVLGIEEEQISATVSMVIAELGFEKDTGLDPHGRDWRQMEPKLLLSEALVILGHPASEAEQLAQLALEKMNVAGYYALSKANVVKCKAYAVEVIWCDANGNQMSDTTYMARNDYNAIAFCPVTMTCPAGESIWYALTMSSNNCLDDTPAPGTCVWMQRISTLVYTVDCELVLLDRFCFDETNPTVNCSLIEQVCGPVSGPDGCPDCGD